MKVQELSATDLDTDRSVTIRQESPFNTIEKDDGMTSIEAQPQIALPKEKIPHIEEEAAKAPTMTSGDAQV